MKDMLSCNTNRGAGDTMNCNDFSEVVCVNSDNNKEDGIRFNGGETISGSNPLQSGETGSSFESGKQEQKATTTTDKFQCQICKESLTSFYNLHRHLKNAHNATVKLICSICGKAFKKNRKFITHIADHKKKPTESSNFSESKFKFNNKWKKSASKPEAKHAKQTRKNTKKTEKSTSYAEQKRKRSGSGSSNEHVKKSKLEDTTEISSPPSVDSDKANGVSIGEPGTEIFVGNRISPPSPPPPPALSPQHPNVEDDWGWDTDPQLSQPKLSTVLELGPPPVSSSHSVHETAPSPKSPPAPDLPKNSVFEDYFEPMSPKQEVFDDWDGEDHVFNSVDTSSIPSASAENPSSFSFQCSKCDLQFQTNNFLKIHRSFHDILVYVKFRCEVPRCFRYFDDAVEYQRHFTSSHSKSGSRNPNWNRNLRKRLGNGRQGKATISSKHCSKKSKSKSGALSHAATHSKMLLPELKTGNPEAVPDPQKIRHSFPCPKCDKRFALKRSVARHLQEIHDTVRPFSCPHCDKSCASNYLLKIHVRNHTQVRSHFCPTCGKAFKSKSHLNEHIRTHNYSDPTAFPCPLPNCSKAFASSNLLRRHMRKILHPPPNFGTPTGTGTRTGGSSHTKSRCQVCNKLFFNELRSVHHCEEAHDPNSAKNSSNRPKFSCDLCEMTFNTRRGWARHKLQHDSNTDILCDWCGGLFLTPKALNAHKKLTHARRMDNQATSIPAICEVCGKSVRRAQNLSRHMKRCHASDPFICDVCGKSCKVEADLMVHKNTHLPEKPFKCKFCPYRYNQPPSIYQHMQYHHTGPGDSGFVESALTADLERNFHCDVDGCSQSFTSLPCLKQHQLYHTGEKKTSCKKCDEKFVTIFDAYVHKSAAHKKQQKSASHKKQQNRKRHECQYCQKSCMDRKTLDSHIRYNHTLEEPFPCTAPDCDRKFKSKSDLRYHTVVAHTGEYKFECEICGKKSATRGNYNAHMRVHTGIRVFRCEEEGCEASFKVASLLKKHLYKEHGKTDLAAPLSSYEPRNIG